MTEDEPLHELNTWIVQAADEMGSEYERIRAHAVEDPGTAGDEGEGIWAQLLRAWLPPSYQVRTKGKVLAHDGSRSRQVDVVVLRPGYPSKLLDKNLYLASGVAAVFECKLTLKAAHLLTATEQAAVIANLSAPRVGTPYRELLSPIVFGVLANSHVWRKAGSAYQHITNRVAEGTRKNANPRQYLDIVCVADTCTLLKSVEVKRLTNLPDQSPDQLLCAIGNFFSSPRLNPIASLLAYLWIRLGWEDEQLRPFAEYFRLARMLRRAAGGAASLHPGVLTPETHAQAMLKSSDFFAKVPWSWDEWAFSLE